MKILLTNISDDKILFDRSISSTFYSNENIISNNIKGIKNRNCIKKTCLEKLFSTKFVSGIPYHTYYMSCNLDHVLHNDANLTDLEKETKSLAFVKKFRSNLDGFIEFMTKSDFSVNIDYIKSWNFIMEGGHSLKRYTNFNLCILNAINETLSK